MESKPSFKQSTSSGVGKFPHHSNAPIGPKQRSFPEVPGCIDDSDPMVGTGSAMHNCDDAIKGAVVVPTTDMGQRSGLTKKLTSTKAKTLDKSKTSPYGK